jgi:hypothetical protein
MEALKANELRTENLLMHNGEVVVIDSIQQSFLSVKGNNYWDLMKDFKRIKLNEKWLIKAGFNKRTPTGHYFDMGRMSINLPDFEYKNIRVEVKLKYVHQLQNLYFALKGEELTLKN